MVKRAPWKSDPLIGCRSPSSYPRCAPSSRRRGILAKYEEKFPYNLGRCKTQGGVLYHYLLYSWWVYQSKLCWFFVFLFDERYWNQQIYVRNDHFNRPGLLSNWRDNLRSFPAKSWNQMGHFLERNYQRDWQLPQLLLRYEMEPLNGNQWHGFHYILRRGLRGLKYCILAPAPPLTFRQNLSKKNWGNNVRAPDRVFQFRLKRDCADDGKLDQLSIRWSNKRWPKWLLYAMPDQFHLQLLRVPIASVDSS